MHWFFPLSKALWFVLAPSHLLLLMALGAAAAALAGRPRATRALAIATAVMFVVIGVLPTGAWLARPLEDAYPRPAPPPQVDGILTLGGGLNTRRLLSRQAPPAAASEARLVSAFELARRYPTARVVFSGGWAPYPDATAARYVFAQLGLDPARLLVEDRSRNTYENLLFSQRLARPKPGETWLLATSALQMPRAMAVARKLGWKLVPWPSDYLTDDTANLLLPTEELDPVGRMGLTDAAVHEWIGLLAYRLGNFATPGPKA